MTDAASNAYMVFYYKNKRIEDMSQEELVECFNWVAKEYFVAREELRRLNPYVDWLKYFKGERP